MVEAERWSKIVVARLVDWHVARALENTPRTCPDVKSSAQKRGF